MTLLLSLLLAAPVISPADSVRSLVTVASVPERALLFAELAARMEGGGAGVELASLLELAGEFSDARRQYDLMLASDPGDELRSWLVDRSRGSAAVDTQLVLDATVVNRGDEPVRDLELMMPLPRDHPPYQRLEIVESAMRLNGSVLTGRIGELEPGGRRHFRVVLRLRQVPGSFRPLPDTVGSLELSALLAEARSASDAEGGDGWGPCLAMARELRTRLAGRLDLEVVGGVVRRGDSLVFHAWNMVADGPCEGMPVDPLLLSEDSLRGIGHCPTDLIPLWNLLSTGGNELSLVCPAGTPGLSIGLSARLR